MNRWQIGQVRVTQVIEMCLPTAPKFFFANPPADLIERHPWLKPHFADDNGKLLASIHAFVVESQGRRIVVDTCIGNDKPRSSKSWHRLQGPFLQSLAEAGFAPESIDTVLCTHLHVDHVGWNTRWDGTRWVPTFANARYLIARREWEHWDAESRARPLGSDAAAELPEGRLDDILGDSVRPVFAAGLVDLVETDHRLTDEVRLEPTPGHTPGHVSLRIDSGGQQAAITGDLMHHPVQCAEPDLSVQFDSDADRARRTRREFLSCCARDGTLVLGTHFAPPTAGRIVGQGAAWRFAVD